MYTNNDTVKLLELHATPKITFTDCNGYDWWSYMKITFDRPVVDPSDWLNSLITSNWQQKTHCPLWNALPRSGRKKKKVRSRMW